MTLDLKNKRFGKLVAIEPCGKSKNGAILWRCLCDCGNETVVTSSNLNSGSTMSCGCLYHDGTNKKSYKHGLSNDRIHRIWRGMKGRCGNPNCKSFKNYGGRGITVCNEWKNDFANFYNWSMENGYSDDKSIDRIDVNGNYEPSNCRWTDIDTQSNNRRNNHYLEIEGKRLTITQWSRISGIDRKTITDRIIRFGYSPKEAVFLKPDRYGRRRH